MKTRLFVLIAGATVFFGVLMHWGGSLLPRKNPSAPSSSTQGNPTGTDSSNPAWTSEPIADPPATDALLRSAPVQTYEILGRTWQELETSVETFGTNRQGAPSYTTYSLVWHPGGADNNGGLTNGTASAEIVVTLPHWVATATTTDEAKQWWSYFIRRQAESQQQHVLKALEQADSATQSMRVATKSSAEEVWRSIQARLEEEQRSYDAAHGNVETDLRFEPSRAAPALHETAALSPGTNAVPLASKSVTDAGPGFPSPLRRGSVSFSYSMPLQTLEGSSMSLESKRGQVIVLNFWATWCGFCLSEMPSFESLMQQVHGENIVFAFVTTESASVVKQFLARKNWSIPIYFTNTLSAAQYTATGIPETLILSKLGEVVMKVPGARDWGKPQVVAYLRALANE